MSAFGRRIGGSSRGAWPRLCGAALLGILLLAAPALAQNRVPGERALEALVKATLLTFNDANVTGNFTVFHAKLAKPFRQQYTPERLKETFKTFAEQHIDFDVIAAYKPVYDPAASVGSDGRLLVNGYFPTEPTRVLFDLAFIPSDGEWKLISIHVKTEKAP